MKKLLALLLVSVLMFSVMASLSSCDFINEIFNKGEDEPPVDDDGGNTPPEEGGEDGPDLSDDSFADGADIGLPIIPVGPSEVPSDSNENQQ